jgi:hypothetical protein
MSGAPQFKPGAILGAVIGIPIGFYSGFNVLFPIAFGFVLFKILQSRPGSRSQVLPAVAIQGGHILWMALGAAITRQFGPVSVDIIVIGVLLCWIWARPSALPLWALVVLQTVALFVNGAAFIAAAFGTAASKALLVHVILRIAGIVANLKAMPPRRSEETELQRAA